MTDIPSLVVVHPTVLLSVVDHYNRVARDTSRRVVGVFLGSIEKGIVDVTNSYAVPFDEDDSSPNTFFFNHNYHENMFDMFKKVNAREKVVGWYSSGPKIKEVDLQINEKIREYCANPVFVIVDVKLHEAGIPTKAYIGVEEALDNGTVAHRFQHLPSIIDALEAEEVGVEHLLRDVKDSNISTLTTQISDKITALKSLITRIGEMQLYLTNIVEGKLPLNHAILNHVQEVFNLSPNLSQEALIKAFNVETNDQMLVVYLSSLIRSVIALHNLINNKIEYRKQEDKPPATATEDNKSDKKKSEAKSEKKPETK